MDDKLDRLVEVVAQTNVNVESLRVSLGGLLQATEDHEFRLRGLEGWQHKLTPILAGLTFIAGAVFTQYLTQL